MKRSRALTWKKRDAFPRDRLTKNALDETARLGLAGYGH